MSTGSVRRQPRSRYVRRTRNDVMSKRQSHQSDPMRVVDPRPRFELSPWLYMQLMAPLGTKAGSVAACATPAVSPTG